jgi:chitodextrinase
VKKLAFLSALLVVGVASASPNIVSTTQTSVTVENLSCGTKYRFEIRKYTANGDLSPTAEYVDAETKGCPDTGPPSQPQNLAATGATETSISVSWSASTDDVGVTGYDVYRGGARVDSTSATSYTFGGLSCGTTYALAVEAHDAAGKRSSSSAITASTNACPPLSCPTGEYSAHYYGNMTFSGTPVLQRCEAAANHDWGGGSPAANVPTNQFSTRWTGTFSFTAGAYEFTAIGDDGIRVWVDGALVIDSWRDQPPTTYRQTRSLTAGNHDVKIEYYENGGGAVARVSWQLREPPPPPPPTDRFVTLAPGSMLPSGADCATRVRHDPWEPRPENMVANHTTVAPWGTGTIGGYEAWQMQINRIDGNFTGTTDEIIQWGACKWGLDEDIVRGMAVVESNWFQSAVGDAGQSFGLLQTKRTAHPNTFPRSRDSTAWGLDYNLALFRANYEGKGWLPNLRGDLHCTIGHHFSGNGCLDGGEAYADGVEAEVAQKDWLSWPHKESPEPAFQFAWFPHNATDGTTAVEIAGKASEVILTGDADVQLKQDIRAAGYEGRITHYVYAPACSDHPQPWTNQLCRGGEYGTLPDSYFLHDGAGNRLYRSSSQGAGWRLWAFNPGSAGFRTWAVDRMRWMLDTWGYDGIFFDEVWGYEHFRQWWGNTTQSIREYPTDDSFWAAWDGFLARIKAELGVPVLANTEILEWHDQTVDGTMVELFATGWGPTAPMSAARIQEIWARLDSTGREAILVGRGERTDTATMRFALAAYMMIARPGISFRYSPGVYWELWWYPEFDQAKALGAALGPRQSLGNGRFQRDFQNGTIVVDLNARTGVLDRDGRDEEDDG